MIALKANIYVGFFLKSLLVNSIGIIRLI